MAKHTFTNTAKGARGVRTVSGELIMIEPGQTVEDIDVSDIELKDVKAAGELEIGKAAAARAAKADDDEKE